MVTCYIKSHTYISLAIHTKQKQFLKIVKNKKIIKTTTKD